LLTAFFFSSLEDIMLQALPYLFPNPLGTASGARVEFYDRFRHETDEYDSWLFFLSHQPWF